jgi:hypothetical protein
MAARRLPFAIPAGDHTIPSSLGGEDSRATLLLQQDKEDKALTERARVVLSGAGATLDGESLGRVVGELRGIYASTDAIKTRMVDIGRRLLRVSETAGSGGYRALFRAGLIPLSEAVASKLRNVALAVETGRIPEQRLPLAIRAAYFAVTLPDDQLAHLLAAGVLRPDATQRMLEEFLDRPEIAKDEDVLSPKRRQQLLRRLKRLEGEVRALRRRLGMETDS